MEDRRRTAEAAAEEGLLSEHKGQQHSSSARASRTASQSSRGHPREETSDVELWETLKSGWTRASESSNGDWSGVSSRWRAVVHFFTPHFLQKSSWKRVICALLAVLSALVILTVLVFTVGGMSSRTDVMQSQPHSPTDKTQNPGPGKGKLPTTAADAFCTTWSNKTTPLAQQQKDGPKRPKPAALTVKKPEGIKIVALVFYGRRRTVDILDCYLQQNLAVNGGVLDEVRFVAHTKKKPDLEWLDQLVNTTREYKKIDIPKKTNFADIWRLYGSASDTMYIKIDDDITWIGQNTITQLVKSRLEYKEPLLIAANLINAPVTSWLHHRLEAVHGYLPEKQHRARPGPSVSWRPSELPLYSDKMPNGPSDGEAAEHIEPPYEGHRWLPLEANSTEIWKTPINAATPDKFSSSWKSWGMAAQQHMSLLQNIENDQLGLYTLERNGGMINTQYKRYNLNFVAVWGSDIAASVPFAPDDEEALTVAVPRKFGRPVLIDTHALVGHFSFSTQAVGMALTDILDRYRAYANEAICTADNQKFPVDRQCHGF